MQSQFSLFRHAPGAAACTRPQQRPVAVRPNLRRSSPICNVLDMSQFRAQRPQHINQEYQNYTAYVLELQQQQQRQAAVQAAAEALRNEPRTCRPRKHAPRMSLADYSHDIFTSLIAEAPYGAPFRIPDEGVDGQPIGDGGERERERVRSHPLLGDNLADIILNGHNGNELQGLLTPAQATALAVEGSDSEITTTPPVCSLQHPGITSCTTTTVVKNDTTNFCLLTTKVLTRVTDRSLAHYTMEDLAAVGARALEAAATAEVARHVTQQQLVHLSKDRLQQHRDLQTILESGKIVRAKKNATSQFGHESYNLQLQDPATGREIGCLFKPRVKGDSEGWHRVPIELVAYELGLLLGMDYVPPVAYRSGGIDVDGAKYQEGAFIYFAKGVQPLKSCAPSNWPVQKHELLSDTRILDVLLHNSDRHHGHFLIGEHWVDGAFDRHGVWHGAPSPILIDHAAGFRREAFVSMEHENAFATGPVKQVSARTYLRLRFLDAKSVKKAVGHHLSEAEVGQLLQRRDYILEYIDGLIAQSGFRGTVIDVA